MLFPGLTFGAHSPRASQYDGAMDAEGAYLFRHGVLRDAAYDLMPPSMRTTMHGLVADCLITLFAGKLQGVSAEIANHLAQGGTDRTDDEARFREMAAKYAEASYAHDEAVEHYRLLADNEALTNGRRAMALEQMAFILDISGRREQTDLVAAELAKLAIGDEELIRIERGLRARIDMRQGRSVQAEQAFRELAAGYHANGNKVRELAALGNLNNVCKTLGKLDEAEGLCKRCLELAVELGDRNQECLTLSNLATLYGYREDYASAEDYAKRGIALARKAGERHVEGGTLSTLALIYRRQGRPEEAEKTYNEALVILREIGSRLHEGVALGNLGSVVDTLGRHAEAITLYQQALAMHRRTGNRRFEGIHLGALAMAKFAVGDVDEVRAMMDEAIRIVEAVGDKEMAQKFRLIRESQ